MVIGFAGSGNMAAALARGWRAAAEGPEAMFFTDAGSGRAAQLAAETGGEALADNRRLAERVELVVLGFKPKDLEAAAPDLQAAPAVLSLLNATALERVRELFPGAEAMRLMPNLAVETGRGVMGLVADERSERARRLTGLLEQLGTVFRLEDRLIDAFTAVAGCSPAYLDLFVDALGGAGARAGLDPAAARAMVIETMAGTAELLREREAGELRRQVASPGGSTEAGLASLEADRFADVVARAADSSLARMRGEL